ncbi:hypothetical protein [Enterovibrio coralii]|uniref:Uncharacterized protein n=1 Tax=Enterovibrio coralii TaxID=294935 RepID=A0A135IC21_9GAMM|nr:hypothetical protein [Enterovibrio coralii]KXF82975.1 hypothetical protein ATN88_04275 [Enterovibrio coralii]
MKVRRSDNIYQVDLIAALFGGFMITWLATTRETESTVASTQLVFATLELELEADTGQRHINLLPRSIAERPVCAPESIVKELALTLPSLAPCQTKIINDVNWIDFHLRQRDDLATLCRIANQDFGSDSTSDLSWKGSALMLYGVDINLPKSVFVPLGTTQFKRIDDVTIDNLVDLYRCNITLSHGAAVSVFITSKEVYDWIASGRLAVATRYFNFISQLPTSAIEQNSNKALPRYFHAYQDITQQYPIYSIQLSNSAILRARLCLHKDGEAICYKASTEWAPNAELNFVPESEA